MRIGIVACGSAGNGERNNVIVSHEVIGQIFTSDIVAVIGSGREAGNGLRMSSVSGNVEGVSHGGKISTSTG